RPRLLLEPTMMPTDHAPGSDGFRAELARLEVKDVAYTLDTVEVVGARQARIGHDDAREHIEYRQERQVELRRRRHVLKVGERRICKPRGLLGRVNERRVALLDLHGARAVCGDGVGVLYGHALAVACGGVAIGDGDDVRSEERRVGKECGYRRC